MRKRYFFEKKSSKKLLELWAMGCRGANAHDPAFQSFFAP